MVTERPRVVVIGGGFGGLAAVRGLKKAEVDITLIDRHAYNTFQPLLYQVATAALNPGDVTWFLRSVRASQRNVRFVKGSVGSIDADQRTVGLVGGRQLGFDYLVIATGVTANFFGVPGAAEHALPLYTRTQALRVRDAIFAGLEHAAALDRDPELRVVVVGGGPTGVETSGALAELRNRDMPITYPELDSAHVHVTLVEMGDRLLPAFHRDSSEYTRDSLVERGVDLRLNTKVEQVRPDGVVIGPDRAVLPAGLVIWASGITGHPVVEGWGLPLGRGGRIEVDEHFRVLGHRHVFAVGDSAIGPEPLIQQAQPALQAGKHAAKVIASDVSGAPAPPAFRYRDKGILATIGRSSAVAEVSHLPRLTGFPAWSIWTGVHVMGLLGNRNRFATMVNLGAKYIIWPSSHNAIVGDTSDPRGGEETAGGASP